MKGMHHFHSPMHTSSHSPPEKTHNTHSGLVLFTSTPRLQWKYKMGRVFFSKTINNKTMTEEGWFCPFPLLTADLRPVIKKCPHTSHPGWELMACLIHGQHTQITKHHGHVYLPHTPSSVACHHTLSLIPQLKIQDQTSNSQGTNRNVYPARQACSWNSKLI